MTREEQILTVAAVIFATMLTRFLPFLFFPRDRKTPPYIRYLGRMLPASVFSLLVVYCLRHVDIASGSHGLPEWIAVAATILLHRVRRQMLLSIGGGTLLYMLLVQTLFS
ncbi:MAG: branched-chain amino acid transporter permease [Mitsuokella sp.]